MAETRCAWRGPPRRKSMVEFKSRKEEEETRSGNLNNWSMDGGHGIVRTGDHERFIRTGMEGYFLKVFLE